MATTADSDVGGSSFDQLLAEYFVEDFKKRYRIDASRNPRAYLRLLQECERLKKLMSANSQDIPINIECFMDEKDVSGTMSREVMEKLADELFRRIEFQLRHVLVCASEKSLLSTCISLMDNPALKTVAYLREVLEFKPSLVG